MKALSLALFFLFISAGYACPEDVSERFDELSRENQMLTSELTLAKKKSLYFIFDLQNRKIYFRYRGTTLKEIAVDHVKIRGQLPHRERYTLIKKATFFEPRRSTIDPTKRERDGTIEIDSLELKDMPSSFYLLLDDETALYIKQKPHGFFSHIASFTNSATHLIRHPLCSIWRSFRDRPCNSFSLIMSRENAQSVYWSFSEGMEAIISAPGR